MGLSEFQRLVCRLLAQDRVRRGESYVAGGAALNEVLGAPRLSRDIDLFHDTEEALVASWEMDRSLLASAGYDVRVVRERRGFVEAEVVKAADSVLVQWVRDSAYRFFPLVEHPEFGLTLHPFDLATSKVLALVGRVEPRDFVDTMTCTANVQPLGYLAWAACGKEPGFNPASILSAARRTVRYSAVELRGLDYQIDPPDPAALLQTWRAQLADADSVVSQLPSDKAGTAVLDQTGRVYRGSPDRLSDALSAGGLSYHEGSIRGAFPHLA